MLKVEFSYKNPELRKIIYVNVLAETEKLARDKMPNESPSHSGYFLHEQVSAIVVAD